MNPIEYAVSLLAPHQCLLCKKEGLPVCKKCTKQAFTTIPPACYRCSVVSTGSQTCLPCSQESPINCLWPVTRYGSTAQELIKQLKFQRIKAAATVIANCLNDRLPTLQPDVLVSPVPTANARIRTRGYDQACLIAHIFARKRGLTYGETLRRVSSTRQVGANRRDRFRQLEGAFAPVKPARIENRHIVLIDDVLTTGATLEAAARIVEECGATQIDAAVFAWA